MYNVNAKKLTDDFAIVLPKIEPHNITITTGLSNMESEESADPANESIPFEEPSHRVFTNAATTNSYVKMPLVVSNVLYDCQWVSRLFIREAVCACREVSGTCEFGAKLIVDMLLQVSYCSTTFSQSLMDELMKQYNQVNSGELKNLSTLMLEILVSQFY